MANHPHDKNRPESLGVRRALEADDMDMLRDALTYRQRRFCEEYVIDFNGAAACVRAGYSPKWGDRQAHLLFKNKGIERYIDHLQMSKESKLVSVNPEYVIQRVMEIIGKENAKDGDRLRGLELLARHLGMFIERTEITGKDGEAIRIEQQKVEEEAKSFTNLMKQLRDRQVKKDVTIP